MEKTVDWIQPLKTWRGLLKWLRTAKENEIWKMLSYEVRNKKRISTAERLYGKANELRAQRERKELEAKCGK